MSRATFLLVAVALLASCRFYAEARSEALPDQLSEDRVARGLQRFAFDDLGGLSTDTLETYAVPFKLAALSLFELHEPKERTPAAAVEALARYGYFVPTSVGNWPTDLPAPSYAFPVGLTRGVVDSAVPRVEVDAMTNGCASCHGGHLWDAAGNPTRVAWLGLPNTSINNQGYTVDLFRGMKRLLQRDDEAILAELESVFPDLTTAERATFARIILPAARRRYRELAGRENFVDFLLGGPGYTNGVASIKMLFGVLDEDAAKEEVALTSIPDVGGRHLRTSLLYDGVYAPPGRERQRPLTLDQVDAAHLDEMGAIPAIFTMGTMGIRPERAAKNAAATRDIYAWIRTYEAPPFPGPVDVERAVRGEAVYQSRCQTCHGEHAAMDGDRRPLALVSFPNLLVPTKTIGTDDARTVALDDRLSRRFSAAFGALATTQATGGYVATPLTSLWATAPYLHNGSVPTLWHLMHPEARPARFQLGGHRLDHARVGVHLDDDGSYPDDYAPWSVPINFDTSKPGQSSAGHEGVFRPLSEEQKTDLLEYLKLL